MQDGLDFDLEIFMGISRDSIYAQKASHWRLKEGLE